MLIKSNGSGMWRSYVDILVTQELTQSSGSEHNTSEGKFTLTKNNIVILIIITIQLLTWQELVIVINTHSRY